MTAVYYSGTDGDDIIFGTNGNDELTGLNGVDQLFGYGGDDVLIGGNGADTISGGDGNDSITGGAGEDVLTGGNGIDFFIFSDITHSTNDANADHITDFASGADQLDLSGITAGNATYIGSAAFSGTAMEVRAADNGSGDMVVRVDVDGDGSADMEIILDSITGVTASDFIL